MTEIRLESLGEVLRDKQLDVKIYSGVCILHNAYICIIQRDEIAFNYYYLI